MKPQLVAVIVLACVAALVINAGVAVVLVGGMRYAEPQFSQWGGNDGVPDAFGPGADGAFPVAAARPCTAEDLRALRGPVVQAHDYRLSGPFTHGNLAVYLIHGPDTMKDQKVLSLQEALDQNLAVVHEGFVSIDNRANVPVFIQAGDIIKGGTQDRVLPYDQLIPGQTVGLPLAAFCVEAGRSGPRQQELSASFASATEQLPGKRLNLAARYHQSQNEVWNGVRQTQLDLARNVGGSVQAPHSQTSLQLTLENHRVNLAIENYLANLAAVPVGKENVIGVAVAVNGQIQGADVYASSALFRSLWPKLLKAGAVAALAERQPGLAGTPPTSEAVQQFLTDAEAGQAYQQGVANQTVVIRQDAVNNLLFDTCVPAQANLVLHRSVLAK